MKTVRIDSIDGIKELVFEQRRNEQNGRYRSSYMYRGLANAAFRLETSLKRNCGDLSETLEMHILENFLKYASLEDPTLNDSVWKAMIIGQHHGLPTRLLDWTPSTLVALHFALTESNMSWMDKTDCAVWRIDIREMNKRLPAEYRKVLEDNKTSLYNIDQFTGVVGSIEEYDRDMNADAFIVVEPPSIDQRIVNQYSFFSIIPRGMDDLDGFLESMENSVKYVISKDLRWDLRDILDQMNMNERIIYPGLDGIARWIGRHYYVKR